MVDHPASPGKYKGYQFIKRLGQGGFGTVYLANPPGLKSRYVAIKYIERRGGQHEVDILEQLVHDNIVQIHAAYEIGSSGSHSILIVMEYVEGGSLQGLLKAFVQQQRLLDYDLILSGMSQVAEALSYIHSRDVLHLDLKPANILLKPPSGQNLPPKFLLTDFGIARITRPNDHLSTSGGTPPYMSPEHFRSASNQLDHRSDIYSLGIILYQMVTGHLPFFGSPAELAQKHREEIPPPPAQWVDDIPPALNTGILTTLAKRPEERYQSAREVAQMLHGVLGNTRVAIGANRRAPGYEVAALMNEIKAQQTGSSYRLVLLSPDGGEVPYPVRQPALTIGRDPEADIVLRARQVSRQHVQIDNRGRTDLFVVDMGSRQGTFLNGTRLLSREAQRLQSGDWIDVAGYAFNVQEMETEHETLPELSSLLQSEGSDDLIAYLQAENQRPQIRMVVNPQIIALSIGQVQRAAVSVTPSHTKTTTYHVQLSPGRNIDPTWYQVAYPKEIAPGETGHFELIFNIPSNAEVRAGDYEASVAVVAEDDIPAAVQNIQIKILSELDFDVNLQYNEVKQRFLRKTRNKLIIRNNSIQPERFTISIEVPDTLRVESQESTVELDAQQTREIPLSFHPRRSGERHQPYAIRVKPRFGAAKERSGIFVARRQKLPLPSLATVIFLLVMLALLLVLADQFLLDGLIREIVVEMLPFPFQLPPIQ